MALPQKNRNWIAQSYFPGSNAPNMGRDIRKLRTETLGIARKVMEKSGLTSQTIYNIESGRTENPSFNNIAKLLEAIGLCLVVDISSNTERRMQNNVHPDDSPLAVYGFTNNPIEQLSQFLKKVIKAEKIKIKEVAMAAEETRDTTHNFFQGKNVSMQTVLNILSTFDYTISMEFREYHLEWDKVGKLDCIIDPDKPLDLALIHGSQVKNQVPSYRSHFTNSVDGLRLPIGFRNMNVWQGQSMGPKRLI